MSYNWCHGPSCHEKTTLDRIRGSKGNKVLRTKRIGLTTWNQNNVWSHFCSQGCWHDFMHKHWLSAIALEPRREPLTTPIQDPVKSENNYWNRWTIAKKGVDNVQIIIYNPIHKQKGKHDNRKNRRKKKQIQW